MGNIAKAYLKWLIGLATAVAWAIYSLINFLISQLESTSALISIVKYPAIVVITFSVTHLIFERLFVPLFHSKKYFGGEWEGQTIYTSCEKNFRQIPIVALPLTILHTVHITQTPFRIQILPCDGESIRLWHSTNISLVTDDNKTSLEYAYEVQRDDTRPAGLEDVVFGFETITVMKEEPAVKFLFLKLFYRPTHMRGHFFHCAKPERNLFRGDVIYVRKT